MGSPRSLVVVVAALLVAPVLALAQPKNPPTDEQKKQAGDLVRRAIAKSQAGEHATAIDLYLQAFNIVPNAVLLSNIGTEYEQAKLPNDALKYFCKYLDADPNGQLAQNAIQQAKALQAQLGNTITDDKDVCKPKKATPPPPPPPPPPPDKKITTGTTGGGTETGAGSGSDAGTGSGSGAEAEVGGPVDTGSAPGKTMRTTGLAVGAVGIVLLGIGGYYGLKAKSLNDQING